MNECGVVSPRKKVIRLSKYIEGFYCKDEDSIECIKTDSTRTVLDVLYKSYPLGKTKPEIMQNQDIKEKGIPDNTVDHSLTDLREANFLVREKKVENTVKNTGRRVNKHDIENLNTVLNENFGNLYQFAPGYVEYNPNFLEVWNKVIDKNEQDEIYPLLIRLLRRAFTKMPSLNDKEMEPTITDTNGKEIYCPNCGVNHEARDFIRAILLRLIDQLEINDSFFNFMQEKHLFNDQGSELYREACTRSKAEALTMRKPRPLTEASKELSTPKRDIQEHKRDVIKLRIISIEKDTGKNEIPFLAMDAHRNWIHCTVDSTLLTDDMIPDSMIKCIPSELLDDENGYFLSLSKDDSYIETIEDDESFPKPIKSIVGGIYTGVYLPDAPPNYFVTEGNVLEKPEGIEILLKNGKTVPLFYTTIGDATGQIKVQEFHGSTLNKLSVGDRIKVIGAMAIYGPLEDERLLQMNEYSSIIKLPSVSASTIDKVYPEKEVFSESGTVEVSKEQLKNGIHVQLHRLKFFKDCTEADISITNDNTDDELELSEGDSRAFQNNKLFALTQVRSVHSAFPSIKHIPPREFHRTGVIKFEALDHTQRKAKFQFKINRKPLHDSYDFTFDVNIAKINQNKPQ